MSSSNPLLIGFTYPFLFSLKNEANNTIILEGCGERAVNSMLTGAQHVTQRLLMVKSPNLTSVCSPHLVPARCRVQHGG